MASFPIATLASDLAMALLQAWDFAEDLRQRVERRPRPSDCYFGRKIERPWSVAIEGARPVENGGKVEANRDRWAE